MVAYPRIKISINKGDESLKVECSFVDLVACMAGVMVHGGLMPRDNNARALEVAQAILIDTLAAVDFMQSNGVLDPHDD